MYTICDYSGVDRVGLGVDVGEVGMGVVGLKFSSFLGVISVSHLNP